MPRTILTLTEYQPRLIERDQLSERAAERLWREFRAQVEVEPPSFKTGNHWRLTAQGWVGFLPITPQLGLSLQPKVPLRTLFSMIDQAYDLGGFHLWDTTFPADSLADFYETLALILARRVLARCNHGLARSYHQRNESLPFVRGRIALSELLRQPVVEKIPCHFEEQSSDNQDNQILLWTLHCLLRGGLCGERSLSTVQRAYRALHHSITLRPASADVCRNRRYQRLNADYRLLHLLCAFFLEQAGPTHTISEKEMLAFAIDSARLYERFVAKWLRHHLPAALRVQAQERVDLTPSGDLRFEIDLVLYERTTVQQSNQRVLAVMDTKYKVPLSTPASDDVAQVIAYAQAKGANEAVLIYPVELTRPIDQPINGIQLRTLAFRLDGDLDAAGHELIDKLIRTR